MKLDVSLGCFAAKYEKPRQPVAGRTLRADLADFPLMIRYIARVVWLYVLIPRLSNYH